MMVDPYDQQYPVGDDTIYPPGGIAPGGSFQDPNCSIQFDELTPSEVGGYPGSQVGGYPPSQMGGGSYYGGSQVGGSSRPASARNEQMV